MTNDESSKNENGRKENPESPSAQQLVAIDAHQNTHMGISVNLPDIRIDKYKDNAILIKS